MIKIGENSKNPENLEIRKIRKSGKPGNLEKSGKITGQMSGKTLNSISDEIGWCKTLTKQNREDFEKSWGKKSEYYTSLSRAKKEILKFPENYSNMLN